MDLMRFPFSEEGMCERMPCPAPTEQVKGMRRGKHPEQVQGMRRVGLLDRRRGNVHQQARS